MAKDACRNLEFTNANYTPKATKKANKIIKNKQLFVSSECFSALEKNDVVCSQRAMLPIPLGVTAQCR
jgi:hypothetical protein